MDDGTSSVQEVRSDDYFPCNSSHVRGRARAVNARRCRETNGSHSLAASNRRVPRGAQSSSLRRKHDPYQGMPSQAAKPLIASGFWEGHDFSRAATPNEYAFRRWIWAFEFHHGLA